MVESRATKLARTVSSIVDYCETLEDNKCEMVAHMILCLIDGCTTSSEGYLLVDVKGNEINTNVELHELFHKARRGKK